MMEMAKRIGQLSCFGAAVLLAGSSAALAQAIDLSQADSGGSAFTWIGTRQNARAGTSLLGADMSGDIDRSDLVVGAPGAGTLGQGQVFINFMGPAHVGS